MFFDKKFDSKREALKVAARAICLANIPLLNFGVAFMAAASDQSDEFDEFEKTLKNIVLVSAILYFPAEILLAPAATFLALNFAFEMLESCFDFFSKNSEPAFNL